MGRAETGAGLLFRALFWRRRRAGGKAGQEDEKNYTYEPHALEDSLPRAVSLRPRVGECLAGG